ncbi:MAG: hypothetical protein RI920_405 [Pseudomonadota bacterium]
MTGPPCRDWKLAVTAIRLEQVIQTSTSHVLASMADCVDKTLQQMGAQTLAAHSNLQRQVLQRTERELQFKKGPLLAQFGRLYRDEVQRFLGEAPLGADSAPKETDWTALTLVDDAEVERGVQADRLAQQMAQGCEAELEVLSACILSLQPGPGADQHPLRPRVIAEAMLKAVADLDGDDDVAQALAQQLGRVLGEQLGPILSHIVSDWRVMGVRPQGLSVQRTRSASTLSGPGTAPASLSGLSVNSVHGSTLSGTHMDHGGARNTHADTQGMHGHLHHQAQHAAAHQMQVQQAQQAHWQAAQALSQMFGMGLPAGMQDPGAMPAFSATGLMPNGPMPGGQMPQQAGDGWGSYAGRGQSAALARSDFESLIKQIAAATPSSEWQAMQGAELMAEADAAWAADAQASGQQPAYLAQGLAGPMMAVNVIRAHRDELVRASGGAPIDQMVIDIVAALFDQVLSDPKVSPQMARQIARLQMPVLRVALADMGFFNSRKHPVRRFVNRIATLSAAFDDPEHPSGKACLAQVTALVNDVVEGDFDRMELFDAKLAELEAFVEADNAREAEDQARVADMLQRREADLKVQQRYQHVLERELHDLEMPDFVRHFLTEVWTQVQVMVATQDGAESASAERMRQVAHELVVSVQPKGNPALRKAFLQTLPALMKSINQGLNLIQWPEDSKQAFFAQLLPAHAECLKTAPAHELTQRMLEQRLLKVDRIAIPSREEAANDPLPNALIDIDKPPVLTVVAALSAIEAQDAGFMAEAAAICDAPLDIDLDLGDVGNAEGHSDSALDINLDAPPPPSQGLALIHHIQKGTAYNMQMQGQWKKVRLTWISEGRNFFIFTHGHTHKQTISLTARTLAKMCDTGRFRAFEQAELLERATLRARRQLAALSAGARERSAA